MNGDSVLQQILAFAATAIGAGGLVAAYNAWLKHRTARDRRVHEGSQKTESELWSFVRGLQSRVEKLERELSDNQLKLMQVSKDAELKASQNAILRREVNDLCRELGRDPKYRESDFV